MAPPETTERENLDDLFSALAHRERRRLLGCLYERAPDALTRRDLTTSLVPASHDTPNEEVTDEQMQSTFDTLHHTHLPKLEAANLIKQHNETVTITDHAAFADAGIVDAITSEESSDSESLDALFQALKDSRRRTVLDILSHQYQPIHVETLAREVGAKEANIAESEVSPEEVERILVDLHHVHLPHLSEAGLITHEVDEETVAYEGHPALRVPWVHSVLGPDFRATLTGESHVQEVGTIEGRENVISFGQSLCDRADDELFCLFTSTELLEAGCFTRIRDASRRGVDVYLGTCDPTVQEFVQEHAPDIVLWEPHTDWLNFPVEDTRVGRLLLADREAVMLGTLGETMDDGVPKETAIIGEGADNTLVVMIRQTLGSRLEQIDTPTEEIESQLPF